MNTNAHLADLTAEERPQLRAWPMTDELRMEAAMCIWEAFLDIEGNEPHMSDAPLSFHLDRVGTVQMRHDLMALVEPLSIGWHVHQLAAGDAILCPFDWGFTPWFLNTCVEVDSATGIGLKPGWLDLCRGLRDGR